MTATRKVSKAAQQYPSGFSDPAVKAAFDRYPSPVKARLMALRQLIFETSAGIEGVGPLQENLKWKQPSYLTSETKSGSTIRLDRMGPQGSTGCSFNARPIWLRPSVNCIRPS